MSTPQLAIELRHLRYFLAVADELHFGRAAERLHIAQPPLSQAIRKLERELGVQLLHRTSRVVIATEPGKVFAEEARKVLAAFDLAVAEARRAGGAGSTLRIGCTPFVPVGRLETVLDAIRAHESGLTTRVTHLPSQEQRSRLIRGELDVGIFQVAGYAAGLTTEAIFPGEPLAAFLPHGHRLERKQQIGPEDVADEVLVKYPRPANPTLYDRFYGMIEDGGYRFRATVEAGGTTERDLLFAAAQGLGILLGAYSLKDITPAGRLVVRRPLEREIFMPDTVIAWRSDPAPQFGRLVSILRAVAHDLRARNVADAIEESTERDAG